LPPTDTDSGIRYPFYGFCRTDIRSAAGKSYLCAVSAGRQHIRRDPGLRRHG